MQIGRVAQSTGLSVDTIRFYEKQNLIPLAQRSDAGYRVYDESWYLLDTTHTPHPEIHLFSSRAVGCRSIRFPIPRTLLLLISCP